MVCKFMLGRRNLVSLATGQGGSEISYEGVAPKTLIVVV